MNLPLGLSNTMLELLHEEAVPVQAIGERRYYMEARQTVITFCTDTGKTSVSKNSPQVSCEATLGTKQESNVVCVYPDYTFQTIDGFGCAMTEGTCYLLSKMEPETREAALKCWFGPDGMNARFIRIPIDSCDYSLEEYQAVADPLADPELETFSIDRDRMYILPVVKEALELAGGQLSVLMSPWSPPYQWKTPPEKQENDTQVYGGLPDPIDYSRPDRKNGGRLKSEYYGSWARYLVKYVQAYLNEGIPVTMLTVQNEASAATNWDSCVWSGEEESIFLRDHLYPELERAGHAERIGIYVWDHNKERMIEHIDEMMANGIEDLVQGFAYHWYSGDHFGALSLLHGRYPDMMLMHSESCGLHMPGRVLPVELPDCAKETLPPWIAAALEHTPAEVDYADAVSYAHDIIGDINNGVNRFIDWNLTVDKRGGPRHVAGGFAAPIVTEDDGSYSLTVSYHFLKAIAQAVQPGAVRLGISTYGTQVEAAAVKNAVGSTAILLLNRDQADVKMYLRLSGTITGVLLPAGSLSTVTFDLV